MKRALNLLLGLAVFGPLLSSTTFSSTAYGQATGESIVSRTAEIDGVKLHYMTAGHEGAPASRGFIRRSFLAILQR